MSRECESSGRSQVRYHSGREEGGDVQAHTTETEDT